MLRYLTAGESHGKALVVIVEGLPAGLAVTSADVAGELARRRLGYGRGPRMRFEADEVTLLGGVRHGRTLGGPVAIEIGNTEWPKWEQEMSPDPGAPSNGADQAPPRARRSGGHAEVRLRRRARRARARLGAETAARVAAGCLAKALLARLEVSVLSHVVALGPVALERVRRPRAGDLARSTTPRCAASTPAPRTAWWRPSRPPPRTATRSGGGGGPGLRGTGGLGSHVHWDRRLDGLLAQALMSIQAVKFVEFGDGSDVTSRRARRPTTPSAGTTRAPPTAAARPGGRHRGRDVHRGPDRGPGAA